METTSKYSSQRTAGREHFPLYPKGFIAIRIIQLVFGVIVIGLAGYGVAAFPFDGIALNLFVGLATLIATIYYLVAEHGAPRLYNYWAVLGLDIFLLIFWLIAFALLASEVSILENSCIYDVYGDCYVYPTFNAIMAAAAGCGGVEFVLFLVSLAIHSVMLHRHRKAGLHCRPVASTTTGASAPANTTTAAATSSNAEKGVVQPQPQPEQQQAYQNAPAQGYGQQPQPDYTGQVPAAHQGYAAPQQQQYYQQHQQQVPQQSPSPISSQPTGASMQTFNHHQHHASPVQPGQNVYEAPLQPPDHGPYEADGQSMQQR